MDSYNNISTMSDSQTKNVIQLTPNVSIVDKSQIVTAAGVTIELKDDTLYFSFNESVNFTQKFPNCKEPQTEALLHFAMILAALCTLRYNTNNANAVKSIIEDCLSDTLSQQLEGSLIGGHYLIRNAYDYAKLFIHLDSLTKYYRDVPIVKAFETNTTNYFQDHDAFEEELAQQSLLTRLNQWEEIYESFPEACQTFLNIDTIEHAQEFACFYHNSAAEEDNALRNSRLQGFLFKFIKLGYISFTKHNKSQESKLQKKKQDESPNYVIFHQAVYLIATFFLPEEYRYYKSVKLEFCKRPQGTAENATTKERFFYLYAKVDDNLVANTLFDALHYNLDSNQRNSAIRRLSNIEDWGLKQYLQQSYDKYCRDKMPLLRFCDAPQPLLDLGFDCQERAKCMLRIVTEMSEEDKEKLIRLMFPEVLNPVEPSSIVWKGSKQELAEFAKSFTCKKVIEDADWKVLETYFVRSQHSCQDHTGTKGLKNSRCQCTDKCKYTSKFQKIRGMNKDDCIRISQRC